MDTEVPPAPLQEFDKSQSPIVTLKMPIILARKRNSAEGFKDSLTKNKSRAL